MKSECTVVGGVVGGLEYDLGTAPHQNISFN